MNATIPKEPWLIKICPERHRRWFIPICFMVGVIGRFVFYFSGFGVTVFGPFFFAAHHPDAPVSRPILWLLHSVGPQAFACIYFFITVVLAFILLLGTEVYDYLQYKRAA